ncbi:MAG TPA: PEP-CTERM system TPR-repeat protein PrsT [Rhodocyclaceae bacterium]|nr:PEP-CTERM system TPR-repeat protein PrsT [Rhodocyclaceae bacterium]HRQ46834.1 PEP-CTERM system TPR-repeat protein PrsT [Rhodocyclaceae bacterium]
MKLRMFLLTAAITCLGFVHGIAHADPAAAARYYEDGLARFQKDDIAGAIIQLRNALQQDRGMLAAQLLLARAYLLDGEVGPAEVAFEEALRLGVDWSEVAVPLGRVYLARGKPEMLLERVSAEQLPPVVAFEVLTLRGTAHAVLGDTIAAEESFRRARELRPDSALPLVEEVPILIADGRLEVARERAQRAVDLAPGDERAWNALGSVTHAQGDLSAALAHYERALTVQRDYVDTRVVRAGLLIDLGREAEAQEDLEHLRKRRLDEPRASYLRALLASRGNDQATARGHLEEVTRLVDALPPDWLAGREQLLMVGALAHHALGQTSQARGYLDVLTARFPRNAGARRLLAAIVLEQGDYAAARSLLEQVLRSQPDDPQALFLLGRVSMGQQRHAQAVEHLERAVALSGGRDSRMQAALGFSRLASGDADLGLGNLELARAGGSQDPGLVSTLVTLYLRRGDNDKALDAATALVATRPDSPVAQNLLGAVRGAVGDLDGARTAYDEALRLDPGMHPARLNLARLDAAQGLEDKARSDLAAMVSRNRRDGVAMFELGLLELRLGRLDEAINWLEKAFAEQPRSPRVGMVLVDVHLGAGSTAKALDVARHLASRHHDNLDALSTLVRAQLSAGDRRGATQTLRQIGRQAEFGSEALVRVGYLQLQAGSAEDAAYSAHKALTGRPGDPAALGLSVEAALASGRLDQAREFVAELRRLHPSRIEGVRLSGDIAMAAKEYRHAFDHYQEAIALSPDSRLVVLGMSALALAGRPLEAVALGTNWLGMRPTDSEVRAVLAEMHMLALDWVGARDTYRRIIADGRAQATTYNNLANVLAQLGDPDALPVARKAHELAPTDPLVADTLGWLLVRDGRLDEGLRYLRDARLRAPENPEIRYHLAYALARSGRSGEARVELEAALESGLSFESREAAEKLFATVGVR